GDRFEGTDVAPFAADNPPFHLVARQMQDADHALRGLLTGHALDGVHDDVPGPLFGGLPRLRLDVPDEERRLPLGLTLDHFDEFRAGALRGQASAALQLTPLM